MIELNYNNFDNEFLDLVLIDIEIESLIELIKNKSLTNQNLNKEKND